VGRGLRSGNLRRIGGTLPSFDLGLGFRLPRGGIPILLLPSPKVLWIILWLKYSVLLLQRYSSQAAPSTSISADTSALAG